MKKIQAGFTLIELIVVIVVIAILVSITYVSYSGVQNKSKTSGGYSLTQSIGSKVSQYYHLNGSYPTYCQLTTNYTDVTDNGSSCSGGSISAGDQAKLDNPNQVTYATSSSGYTTSVSNSNAVIGYEFCSASAGVDLFYYDYTNSSVTTYKVGTGC